MGAAVNMKALADKIDADLTSACGSIAKDLGDTDTYKNAAGRLQGGGRSVIGDTKAKLGANAKMTLDMTEPRAASTSARTPTARRAATQR